MLADQVLANAVPDSQFKILFEGPARELKTAQRFVLEMDVVQAAEQIADSDPSSLISGLRLCRMPFSCVWIEYVGSHRVVNETSGKTTPKRVGWLLKSLGNNLDKCLVSFIWYHEKGGESGLTLCPVSLALDFGETPTLIDDPYLNSQKRGTSLDTFAQFVKQGGKSAEILRQPTELDAAFNLSNRMFFLPCPFYTTFGLKMRQEGMGSVLEQVMLEMQDEAEAEAGILTAVLMLLNSKNGIVTEKTDLQKLNKRRIQNKKLPLLDHHVLRLNLSANRRRFMIATGQTEPVVRAHLVRGHFKIRRSGIYWWSPFVRGNAKLGILSKDYSVRKSSREN